MSWKIADNQSLSSASRAKQWRDSELERTDTLALLPDYPQAEALLVYRQALRDWTDSVEFPEVKPTLGE